MGLPLKSRPEQESMDKRSPPAASPGGRNAELGLSTLAIHLGYDPADEHGALTPPIFMTSTYAFEARRRAANCFAALDAVAASSVASP
jgi:hypothetical protein